MSPRPLRSLFSATLVFSLAATASADCDWPYWQTTASIQVSSRVVQIATADLNGDGKPDLVAGGDHGLYATLNQGAGTFGPATTLATGLFGGFAVADFTGDGKPDIVLGDDAPNAPQLRLLAGIGDGTFAAPVAFAAPARPMKLEAADFNGDGKRDLAIGGDSTVAILLRTVDGFSESARATLDIAPQAMTSADIDDDGFLDLIVGSVGSNLFSALFGKGDGTFEPVVALPASAARDLATGDLDGDGLPDFGWATGSSAAVSRNLTGRLFGDPLFYAPPTSASMFAIALADVTGDGVLDAVASGHRSLATWKGRETGLGDRGVFTPDTTFTGTYVDYDDLAMGDFDGDGRLDAAATSWNNLTQLLGGARIETYRNRCGESSMTLKPKAPVITAGSDATIIAQLRWPAPNGNLGRLFTGTVTLKEGSTVVGTSSSATTLATGQDFPIVVSGLSAGEHTFTASYSGDAQHEPTEAEAIVQRVTTETSTPAITITPAPQYGQTVTISVNVTSTIAGTLTGQLLITLDGVTVGTFNAPSTSFTRTLSMGSHTVSVQYSGDATHPPGSSTATFEVVRAQLAATSTPGSFAAGQPFQLTVLLSLVRGGSMPTYPSGAITLSENGSLLASAAIDLNAAFITVPALAAGRHYLRIAYAGDASYEPFQTEIVHNTFPVSSATTMDARGTAISIRVSWHGPGDVLIVSRRTGNGPWSGGMCCGGVFWDDFDTTPNTVYVYHMESHDGTKRSNADVGMRVNFTDDPLLAGTIVKALHLTQLVIATNRLRTAAGLAPLSLPIAASQRIAAAHVNTLRNAINEARAGLGVPTFAFTGTIAAGDPIRALHIQELREAVR